MTSGEDLADYINVPYLGNEMDVDRVLATARTMIDRHLIVPAEEMTADQTQAHTTATLRAAAELWNWQHSGPAGEIGWPDGSDFPSPVYRDVFYTVQPTLAHAGLVTLVMSV